MKVASALLVLAAVAFLIGAWFEGSEAGWIQLIAAISCLAAAAAILLGKREPTEPAAPSEEASATSRGP